MLGALGGLAGALGGMLLMLGISIVLNAPLSPRALLPAFGFAAMIGFGVGVVGGPVLTWLFLRRTPIWRAIGETALGAGLATAIAFPFVLGPWMLTASALGGATLAALRLRHASRKSAGALPRRTDREIQ